MAAIMVRLCILPVIFDREIFDLSDFLYGARYLLPRISWRFQLVLQFCLLRLRNREYVVNLPQTDCHRNVCYITYRSAGTDIVIPGAISKLLYRLQSIYHIRLSSYPYRPTYMCLRYPQRITVTYLNFGILRLCYGP